ncbi:MAG: hypothetical protein RIR00_2627 [Pseudomonadota bacterium]
MKKFLGVIGLLALLLAGLAAHTHYANRDLRQLSEQRRAELQRIRPVLLRYRVEQGEFPLRLQQLVPGYLAEIPPSLREEAESEPARRIRYQRQGDQAEFVYHLLRGPDSSELFEVESGRFRRDR